MQTVSNVVFLGMMEARQLEWPPFQAGNYLYARASNPDVSKVGAEMFRTVTPA